MIGQTVSHYRILGKLAVAAWDVYEAEDLKLGRHVALKFIPENLAGDSKSLERFTREARAASLLNHPNICTIHGIEDNNGHPFIVMEKLEGESLKQCISGRALPTSRCSISASRLRTPCGVTCQGNRAPGHQARKHLLDSERTSEGAGFRAGQAGAQRRHRQ